MRHRSRAGGNGGGHGIPVVPDVTNPLGVVRAWLWWWWPADSHETVPPPEELRLRDGSTVWIRPVLPSDRELHTASYAHLSAESKYRRFLTPMHQLSPELLTQLVDDVDGVDHVAYYVFADHPDPVVSVLPIAVGRIKRDPEWPSTADLAVTVDDSWQGRGVATALLPVLVARRPDGVERIVTAVLVDNIASLAMLKRLGPSRVDAIGNGVLEVRIDLVEAERLAAASAEPATATGRGIVVMAELLGRTATAPWRIALRHRDTSLPWLRTTAVTGAASAPVPELDPQPGSEPPVPGEQPEQR